MHSPDGHVAPSSWREFLRAYAMIVLSILTALGFERAAIGLHDRASARDSRVRIERELEADAADLRTSIAKNKTDMETARKMLTQLLGIIDSGKADSDATEAVMKEGFPGQLGISTVTWQRDAWDSAIADQSASHLDQADLQRYALIYAQARDSVESFKLVINGQLVDQLAEIQLSSMLHKMDAHDCALMLMRYIATVQQIDAIEDNLAGRIPERMKKG